MVHPAGESLELWNLENHEPHEKKTVVAQRRFLFSVFVSFVYFVVHLSAESLDLLNHESHEPHEKKTVVAQRGFPFRVFRVFRG